MQGLGGILRRSKYRGPMVFKRTETSHEFFRTPSRILCNQNLLQEQGSSTCQTADGQCVSSSLYQQNGGHPFPNSSQIGYRPLKLVPRPQNTCVGRTPTRSSELEGRQGVSSDNRLQRLEIESSIFQNPCSEMGTFASRSLCLPTITFQLPWFVSWKPVPHAIATDAFLMNWGDIWGYAFPPFALIGRCLQQAMTQNVDHLVLVAPVWPAQPWYPVLLHLAVDKPLLLPVTPELLMKDNQAHPLTNLQLAGWVLSASAIKHQVFRQKLETFCWQHGDETPPVPTLVPGTNGLAGVVNDKLIPFQLP